MKQFLLLLLFLAAQRLYSQQVKNTLHTGKPHFSSKLINVPEKKYAPCMSKEEEAELKATIAKARQNKQIRDSIKQLNGQPVAQVINVHPLFIWPMKTTEDYEMQYKYFVKGNFVDQHPDSPQVRDFSCYTRTYDGHNGLDAGLYPFKWRMMDKMYVYAVAAAAGEIIEKVDGGYDKNCKVEGTPTSNRILLLHADGSVTHYRHLKLNSVTSKEEGDMVEAGEFLGYIGSSGRSSGPHLHFGVFNNNDDLVEPFFAPGLSNTLCTTPYSTETWWQNQPPIWDAKINRVMTHSAEPVDTGCNNDEKVYAKNYFFPGDDFYTGIAISESNVSHTVSCDILRPDGTLFDDWTFSTNDFEERLYEVDGFSLPFDAPSGTWQVRVLYRGDFYYHHFTVGCPGNVTPTGIVAGSKAYISGNTISSTAAHNLGSNGKVMYQSVNSIEFKPGFQAVTTGGFLKTRIAGCNYTE